MKNLIISIALLTSLNMIASELFNLPSTTGHSTLGEGVFNNTSMRLEEIKIVSDVSRLDDYRPNNPLLVTTKKLEKKFNPIEDLNRDSENVSRKDTSDGHYPKWIVTSQPNSYQETIWSENFTGLSDGSTTDTGSTSWSSTITQGTFEVQSERIFFQGTNSGSNATWSSEEIDISNHSNIDISFLAIDTSFGTKESNDYIRGFYILDNGTRIQFSNIIDDFDTPTTQSITGLNGNTLKIEIDFRVSYGTESYAIDNVVVTGTSLGDTQAPENPVLTGVSNSPTTADLNWNQPSDNVGVTGYKIYRDNVLIESNWSDTSYQATGLSAQTSYTFTIKAYDAAGNESVLSNALEVTTNSIQYDPDLTLRINPGGPLVLHDGDSFMADQYFSGGASYQNLATGLDEPFVSERYNTSRTLSYDIPITNGPYRVILYFAELYYGAEGGGAGDVGTRVFDVTIENTLVEDNYDLYASVGAGIVDIKQLDVNITDGELNILLSSLEAIGGAGHPKINAIEILGSNRFGQDNSSLTGGYWTMVDNTNNIYFTDTTTGGNVGIGTDNPGTYKLAVNGTIHSKEVRVDLMNWPDYVFSKDYKLPSLEEVEKHIQERGHLINIPSAAEVDANGIHLGEMKKLLLEKVEELTLYLIEMNKEIKELQEK